MKKILIISHDEDGTSKILIERLREMNHPYLLVDISQFPDIGLGTIDYSYSETNFTFTQPGGEIERQNIKSVWWRRPMGKIRDEPQDSLTKYIQMESSMFIRSLFYLLPNTVRWVSDPDATRIANSKPLQLKLAKDTGLRIPKTLISNVPDDVVNFLLQNHNLELIMKPVGTSLYRATELEGGNRTIYTRRVDRDRLMENIELVRNCPVIFQEAVVQKVDLRSTVVGNRVFTVSITHERDLGAGEDNLDWRNHKLERIFKPYKLPDDIQRMLVTLVQKLGLAFGVIDLCVAETGDYYFFEVNPQGQWVPSELVANQPISKTLAELLVSC